MKTITTIIITLLVTASVHGQGFIDICSDKM